MDFHLFLTMVLKYICVFTDGEMRKQNKTKKQQIVPYWGTMTIFSHDSITFVKTDGGISLGSPKAHHLVLFTESQNPAWQMVDFVGNGILRSIYIRNGSASPVRDSSTRASE